MKGMNRRLSKWGVLHVWENIINKDLLPHNMKFDELICVKKSNTVIYAGYFTIHNFSDVDKNDKFGQILVQFNEEGKMIKRRMMTLSEDFAMIVANIPKELLIFDNRDKFPWLLNCSSDFD